MPTIPNTNQPGLVLESVGDGQNSSRWGSGGAGYASLTGPGETSDPGLLTQSGPFQLLDTVGGGGGVATFFNTVNSFGVFAASVQFYVQALGDGSSAVVCLGIDSNGYVNMNTMPTSNPGGSGRLWNNGGVVNIT